MDITSSSLSEHEGHEFDQHHRRALAMAVLEHLPDAVIGTLDGVIQFWNRGAQRLLGYTAPAVFSQSITLLLPEHALWQQLLERLAQGETSLSAETQARCQDGQMLDILLTVLPVHNAAGQGPIIAYILRLSPTWQPQVSRIRWLD